MAIASGFALRSKGSPFEMGVRTPVMVSWPAKIKAARSMDLAHAIDLLPTIAAAAGLKSPDGLPGINLLDETARSKRDAVFGVCNAIHNMSPGKPDETLKYLWCVEKDWKLLIRYPGLDTTSYGKVHAWDNKEPVRLYHLSEDPHEKVNLANKHPEIVERLKARIEAWHKPAIAAGLPKP